uniref:Uncharacterized protein n=1 Tax=Plectus sambesii TaxID=2011161 RepID=A0A914XAB3_9BILA
MRGRAFLLVVILCFSSKVADAQEDEDYYDQTTTDVQPVVCKIRESEPAYHPNVYECQPTEKCCVNEAAPSCCGTDLKSSAIVEQAIMWGCLIGILLIVGIFAFCYFNDNYCCDPDPDNDGGTYCCCIPASSRYKKRVKMNEYMFPDEALRNKVDDPIFGPAGTANDVPQYASVDAETLKRLQAGKGGA